MPVAVYHPEYGAYTFGGEHPFSPLRIEMVLDLLAEVGISVNPVAPPPVAEEELLRVHRDEYLKAVAAASANGGMGSPAMGLATPDNPIVPGIEIGARRIAGGTLHSARLIADGTAKRVLQMGGGLHHAMAGLASGFCVYNDLAIAIRELVDRGLTVAYLDIDVHHGDGVQRILYDDEHVLTISLHESGEYLFPGTGWTHELGRGMGRGFKLNVPLEPFTEDESYLEVLEKVVEPALEYFRPDVLVFQAGADAHFSDPLADLRLTTQGFERVFRSVKQYAELFTGGRLLATFGGGYSLNATPRIWTLLYLVLFDLPVFDEIPARWLERWARELGPDKPTKLHDLPHPYDPIPRWEEISRHNRLMVERLQDAVAMLWL